MFHFFSVCCFRGDAQKKSPSLKEKEHRGFVGDNTFLFLTSSHDVKVDYCGMSTKIHHIIIVSAKIKIFFYDLETSLKLFFIFVLDFGR